MGDSGPMALIQNFRVFGIACFACIGGLLYGYNQGVFSGVLTMNNFMDRKHRVYPLSMKNLLTSARHGRLRLQTCGRPNPQGMAHLHFGTGRLGRNTAVRLLGGAILEEDQHHHCYRCLHYWCRCSDHCCRRRALIHSRWEICHVGLAPTSSLRPLKSHSFSGMGVGSLSMIVPMYNAECAPPEVRGSLISLQQFAIEIGIMTSFWID